LHFAPTKQGPCLHGGALAMPLKVDARTKNIPNNREQRDGESMVWKVLINMKKWKMLRDEKRRLGSL
jgi:hypothetical protein